MRLRLLLGIVVSAMLVVAVVAWARFADLSRAVIASGIVVVDSSSKKIQHTQGGVIGWIGVRNGDEVAEGDILIKLDDTQLRASLGIIEGQLTEMIGRRARLAAERDDHSMLSFPPGFASEGVDVERVMAGETRLFEARKLSAESQKKQLAERINQLSEEAKGLKLQQTGKVNELELIREELSRVEALRKRDLLPVTRLLSSKREETRIVGEVGTLLAQIAKLGGQVAETQLQIIAVDQNRSADAQKELRDVEGRIAELQERRVAAKDQLSRVELKAPIGGIVHELSVHTIGGVVGPAEQLMLIVPRSDLLSIEARIASNEIDEITIGRPTMLRLTAFNQRTTPELKGTLIRVSPDVTKDAASGQVFYTVRIVPDAHELRRLGEHRLIPGMPVEVFIEMGSRTAFSYLMKPLADQFKRAFRER
ncbi:MAG: HlyD family type I secretion periplasmic adaptor subunit [Proteobacteria bacterium]|nr:HlyD family type I secretion periplasmic adaptor subunit [Pseudomonadota bacterium]